MLLWAASHKNKVGRNSLGRHGSEHTHEELFPPSPGVSALDVSLASPCPCVLGWLPPLQGALPKDLPSQAVLGFCQAVPPLSSSPRE